MAIISVFGLGYVGSVTAACLAQKGHTLIGVDVSPLKVSTLAEGKSPIVEAGADEAIAAAHKAGRLRATNDVAKAVLESEISFISVGTPSQKNGKLDLSAVVRVCEQIGEALKNKTATHTVVVRSTVLPGTTDTIVVPTLERASGKKAGKDFNVCVNPEFLREGSAIHDFEQPPFTVIGAQDEGQLAPLKKLYDWVPTPIFSTTATTCEMVKYLCNTFHALKVSFANEVGAMCKAFNVDTETVIKVFLSDTKLNVSPAYLRPGFAFGGSCLPKDVRALSYRAKESDLSLPLIESILPSNEEHIDRAISSILATGKRKVVLLGLSFKAGTDDLRESPLVTLVKRLIGEGLQLKIHDPNVALGRLIGSNRQYIEGEIPHIGDLLGEDLAGMIAQAEVVIVGSTVLKPEEIEQHLTAHHTVIDLVHMAKPKAMARASTAGLNW